MLNKIVWHKLSMTEWQTPRSVRGYTGQIILTTGAVPTITLTINPGAITSSHPTLGRAKGEFRKFLTDKPVK